MFFVDGPGGTGKTYLFNTIARKTELLGFNSVMTVYTGIAASLLVKAKTCHKTFGLPTSLDEAAGSTISLQSAPAEVFRQANLIIIDEVSMLSRLQLNVIYILLSALSSTRDQPLGGCIIVFSGDFRQTLSTPRRLADRIQVVENTILQHPLWKHVRHFSQLDIVRAPELGRDISCDLLGSHFAYFAAS